MRAERFESFGPTHVLLLGLFVVAGSPLASQARQLTPGRFDVGTSLPLQLCDLAWMAAVWALWSHDRVPTALTHFWGLTLTVQAVLTPSLDESFPDPLLIGFWMVHLLTVWSALYLTSLLDLLGPWPAYVLLAAAVLIAGWALMTWPWARVGSRHAIRTHRRTGP